MSKKRKFTAWISALIFGLVCFPIPAFATDTDVAGAVTSAYNSYVQPQIKSMINGVVFPLVSIILGIIMVVKLSMSVYNYRHNGNQFEWHLVFGLFCGLIVSLTAPHWIWNIIH